MLWFQCVHLYLSHMVPQEKLALLVVLSSCPVNLKIFSISGVLGIVDPLPTTLSQMDEQIFSSSQSSQVIDPCLTILNLISLLITAKQHKQLCNIATHPYPILTLALLKCCFTFNYEITSLLTQYTTNFTKTGSYLKTKAKRL